MSFLSNPFVDPTNLCLIDKVTFGLWPKLLPLNKYYPTVI